MSDHIHMQPPFPDLDAEPATNSTDTILTLNKVCHYFIPTTLRLIQSATCVIWIFFLTFKFSHPN